MTKPAFDFLQNVTIKNWKTGNAVAQVAPESGPGILARSTRFDDNHATANVRLLAVEDANTIGIAADEPIVFEQY